MGECHICSGRTKGSVNTCYVCKRRSEFALQWRDVHQLTRKEFKQMLKDQVEEDLIEARGQAAEVLA